MVTLWIRAVACEYWMSIKMNTRLKVIHMIYFSFAMEWACKFVNLVESCYFGNVTQSNILIHLYVCDMAFRPVNSLCEADYTTPQMTTQRKKLTEIVSARPILQPLDDNPMKETNRKNLCEADSTTPQMTTQ